MSAAAKVAYQDGSHFYDDATGEQIADFPNLVNGDFDIEGAEEARRLFLAAHPEYSIAGAA